MIKPALYGEDAQAKAATQEVLRTVLAETLVLLHPVMPFVTQEIWSVLPGTAVDDIATAPFPPRRSECRRPEAVEAMELFQGVVSSARGIRTELHIEPQVKLDLLVRTVSDHDKAVIEANMELIRFLARIENVEARHDLTAPKASGSAVVRGNEIYVPLGGKVDFEAELARLDKKFTKLEKDLGGVEKKLANKGFLSNAPAEVVEKEKAKLNTMQEERDQLAALRERIQSVMQ
jgi:valyl-tRNA synthetase